MISFAAITFVVATSLFSVNALGNDSACFIKHCSSPDEVLCWSSDVKQFSQYVTTCKILHFEQQDYELRNNLVISDLESLNIIGNGASITCHNMESVMVFTHITMLTVSNITLVNCGATFTSLDITEASSLFLYNIRTVHISNVLFNNSNGYSVYAVALLNFTFIRVICHHGNSKGSSIMIVYSNMSTNTSTNYDVIRSSHCVIDHCRFNSTYPYIISRNSSGLSKLIILALVLRNKTGLVKINISNTHFVSNNRPLILVSYFNSNQSHINMFSCIFINNKPNCCSSPITMNAANISPHDISISSHTLLMQYCSFVSLKGKFIITYLFLIKVNNSIVTMTFEPLLFNKCTIFSKDHWILQTPSKFNLLNSSLALTVGDAYNLTIENVRS